MSRRLQLARVVRAFLPLAVFVAACTDRSSTAPQSSSSFTALPAAGGLQAPVHLSASVLDYGGVVLLSWEDSQVDVSGFLVSRAPDAAGPWSVLRVTKERRTGDAIGIDRRFCYRVAALSSISPDLDSAPSSVLCVAIPKVKT
jgi:hypothetical protein